MEFSLYLITDRRLAADLPLATERALAALPRGAAAVLLREKDLPARRQLELARALLPVCRRHGAPLLVSDRIDVALAAGADGVHLAGGSVAVEDARRLLGGRLVGASCHSREQLEERAGADFAVFSPIFPSPGKGPAVGLPALREACAGDLPIFALGGVDPSNARSCIEAGARGVAAIRGWLAGDPATSAAALYEALGRISQGGPPPPMTRPRALW